MTKKGMSKLIDPFPQPNTHDLYLMMSTICDHDLCEPDPTTNYEPTANQTLMIQKDLLQSPSASVSALLTDEQTKNIPVLSSRSTGDPFPHDGVFH